MRCACPACEATLRFSDELKPGSRVRCPKCDEAFSLPAQKAVAARRPTRDADDDDFEDERPVRRRAKQKSEGGEVIMYAGIGVLAVALLSAGIVLAVVLSRGSQPVAVAQNPAPAVPPAPAPQPATPEPAPAQPLDTGPGQPTGPSVVTVPPTNPRPRPEIERPPEAAPPREREPGPSAEIGLEIGNLAPDIEGQDSDGNRFKLSDYRGKVVLLDFWAGW